MRIERSPWRDAPVDLPHGRIEVAIGDVHGHLAQLDALLGALAGETGGRAALTLLGDLVDRGPDNLSALSRAAADASALGFAERHLLLGNHEIMMLGALDPAPSIGGLRPADRRALWLDNGGDRTLAETGTTEADLARRPAEAAARMRDRVGGANWAVLESAPLARGAGNLLFVHAGVDPARRAWAFIGAADRLSCAGEDHPAWIRMPFLRHEDRYDGDLIVVHGHTPEIRTLAWKGRDPVPGRHALDGWRLGLDGGSYMTGIVAAAEFRRGRYRVVTASAA